MNMKKETATKKITLLITRTRLVVLQVKKNTMVREKKK